METKQVIVLRNRKSYKPLKEIMLIPQLTKTIYLTDRRDHYLARNDEPKPDIVGEINNVRINGKGNLIIGDAHMYDGTTKHIITVDEIESIPSSGIILFVILSKKAES
jgi:hypothetical protein